MFLFFYVRECALTHSHTLEFAIVFRTQMTWYVRIEQWFVEAFVYCFIQIALITVVFCSCPDLFNAFFPPISQTIVVRGIFMREFFVRESKHLYRKIQMDHFIFCEFAVENFSQRKLASVCVCAIRVFRVVH